MNRTKQIGVMSGLLLLFSAPAALAQHGFCGNRPVRPGELRSQDVDYSGGFYSWRSRDLIRFGNALA